MDMDKAKQRFIETLRESLNSSNFAKQDTKLNKTQQTSVVKPGPLYRPMTTLTTRLSKSPKVKREMGDDKLPYETHTGRKFVNKMFDRAYKSGNID